MTTLTESIKPFSFRREEMAIGKIVDGKFVQDRKVWNVTKYYLSDNLSRLPNNLSPILSLQG